MVYEITDYLPSDQEDLVRFFREVLGDLDFGFDLDAKDKDLRHLPDVYQSRNGLFPLARHPRHVIGTIAIRHSSGDG